MESRVLSSSDNIQWQPIYFEDYLYFDINLGIMIISLLVLIHSYFLYNGIKYTTFRKESDLGAIIGIASVILFFIRESNTSLINSDKLYNLFAHGIFDVIIQLCDTYMFLTRLKMVSKFSRFNEVISHAFIWIFLASPKIQLYLILSFYYNINTKEFQNLWYIINWVNILLNIAYNLYTTIKFVKLFTKLTSLNRNVQARKRNSLVFPCSFNTNTNPTNSIHNSNCSMNNNINSDSNIYVTNLNKMIKNELFRGWGHCLISCFARIISAFVPTYGSSLQNLILITIMHLSSNLNYTKHKLWFNIFKTYMYSIFCDLGN